MTEAEAWDEWLKEFIEAFDDEPDFHTMGNQDELEGLFREAFQAGYFQGCQDCY